jgi:putative PIN family toxin of toxin-antitoxin system
MRIVIDANILVSFAIRPNPAFEGLFDLIAAHHVMLVSAETVAERLDVLTRETFRKYLPLDQSLDHIDWYIALAEQVPITRTVAACRDPKDDKFLSLAVSCQADCIVAGGRDLLEMVTFEHIPIYRPADFIRLPEG